MSFSKNSIIDSLVDGIGKTLLPGKKEQEYRVIDEIILDEVEKEGSGVLGVQTVEEILAVRLINFSSQVRDVLLFDKSIPLPWGIEIKQLQDYVRFRLTEIEFILGSTN